jgi:hypothetical protein
MESTLGHSDRQPKDSDGEQEQDGERTREARTYGLEFVRDPA